MQEAVSGKIVVGETTPEIFANMLEYLYTGSCTITSHNVVELLITANRYSMADLQDRCETFLEQGLLVDNAAFLLDIAHTFHSPHLQAVTMNYLREQKSDLSTIEGYSDLPTDIKDGLKTGGT